MKESKLGKTFSISVGEALVAGIVIAVVVACVVAAITTGNWWFLAPVVVLVLACALFAAYVFIYAACAGRIDAVHLAFNQFQYTFSIYLTVFQGFRRSSVSQSPMKPKEVIL